MAWPLEIHGAKELDAAMNEAESVHIREARDTDIASLAPLFDAYRVFYKQPSDMAVARAFLLERLEQKQSVIFIALRADGSAVGFTQLYPSFSSVAAARTFILNDIYVASDARRSGVGGKLLEAAANYGRAQGAVRMSLSTAIDNEAAQALYASKGWVRVSKFFTYNLLL